MKLPKTLRGLRRIVLELQPLEIGIMEQKCVQKVVDSQLGVTRDLPNLSQVSNHVHPTPVLVCMATRLL